VLPWCLQRFLYVCGVGVAEAALRVFFSPSPLSKKMFVQQQLVQPTALASHPLAEAQ
jgi:hypothetical protein